MAVTCSTYKKAAGCVSAVVKTAGLLDEHGPHIVPWDCIQQLY